MTTQRYTKYPNGEGGSLTLVESKGALRNPRVVQNLLSQTFRYTSASIFGTGTNVQNTFTIGSEGVTGGEVVMTTGAAGRAFWTVTLTLTAGQWYALSFEITAFSFPGTDAGVINGGGTATVNGGSISITTAMITAGGVGRYVVFCMSLAGGTVTPRIGVGLGGNRADYSMTIRNIQWEAIDIKNGLVPGEYVYPSFKAAFDYLNPLTVDAGSKVTDSGQRFRFSVRPYSNILVVGDSRNDEASNIAGQLDTLLALNGCAHIYAEGGWSTANAIGPTVKKSCTLTIDKALAGTLLTRTFSTDGNEEMYNYQGSYPFDTLYVSDFGYNDINSNATTGDVTAYNNILTIVSKALALGMKIILSDNNPFKAHATYTAGKLTLVKNLNRNLQNYANQNGHLFVASYQKLGDSTDQDKLSDGLGTTTDYSQDDLHLNDTGSTLVATDTKAIIDANR